MTTPSDPTFVAYIDESGDEGLTSASNYFVMSAAIGLKKDEHCYTEIVDTVKDAIARIRTRNTRSIRRRRFTSEI